MIDILGLPEYVSNPDIYTFIVENCLRGKLQDANTKPTQFLERELRMLGDYITSKLSPSNPNFSLETNIGSQALNQLLLQLKTQPELETQLNTIKAAWHAEIGDLVGPVTTLDTYDTPLYLVSGNRAIVCEENAFAQIMSGSGPLPQLEKFACFNQNDTTWTNLSNRQQTPFLQTANKTQWIQFFPCLDAIYREASKSAQREGYFNMLFPNPALEPLKILFKQALSGPTSTTKILAINSENYKGLLDAITPLLEGDSGDKLAEDHKLAVLALFKLSPTEPQNQDPETNQKRGFLFLVLGSLMTKYTSSAIFGQENDSPEPLRFYANALLKAACDYGAISPAEYTDYSNKLLGVGGAFTCTSVLFNRLNSKMQAVLALHPNDQTYLDIKAMIPPTWQ